MNRADGTMEVFVMCIKKIHRIQIECNIFIFVKVLRLFNVLTNVAYCLKDLNVPEVEYNKCNGAF